MLQQVNIEVDHTSLGDMSMPSVHVSNSVPINNGQSRSSWHISPHHQLVPRHQFALQSACYTLLAPRELVPVHTCEMVRVRQEVRATEGEASQSAIILTRAGGAIALLEGKERESAAHSRVTQRERRRIQHHR